MAQVSFTGYSYRLTDQNIIVFDTTVLTFKAIGDNLEFSYSIASDEGLFSPIDFDPESFDQAYVFTFNGDPLPDLLDPEIAVAWCASIFDYRLIDEGILAIDSTVQFATLEHAEIRYGDTITGTRDGDTLEGGGGADLLKGLGGPDFLFGRGDDDKLLGNGGTDQFYGGSGNDVLRGGRGGDWLTGGARND